jgi:hypothetical protein
MRGGKVSTNGSRNPQKNLCKHEITINKFLPFEYSAASQQIFYVNISAYNIFQVVSLFIVLFSSAFAFHFVLCMWELEARDAYFKKLTYSEDILISA